MANDPKLTIDIDADVSGSEDVKDLSQSLESLERSTGGIIDESNDYALALQKQAAEIASLKQELKEYRLIASTVGSQRIDTTTAVSDLVKLKIVAGESRGELYDLIESIKNLAKEQKAITQVRQLETNIGKLRVEAASAEAAILAVKEAVQDNGFATAELAQQLTRAEKSYETTTQAITQAEGKLREIKTRYQIAGEGAEGLAEAQDKLNKRFATSRLEADKFVDKLSDSKTEYERTGATFGRLTAQIERLEQGLAGSQPDIKAIAKELKNLQTSVDGAAKNINDLPAGMRQLGASTSATTPDVKKLSSTLAGLREELKKPSPDLNRISKDLQDLRGDMQQATKTNGEFAKSFGDLRNALIGFFGIYELGGFINDTRKLNEEWADLEARLKVATESEEELIDVRERLVQSSKDTFTTLSENIGLYVKLKDATQNLGTTNEELIKFTDTWNKTLQLNGSSAEGAAGATLQLSQALGSGFLRGEEFNSIAEQNSFYMQRLAKVILGENGTVGALKAYASQGKLTADQVLAATKKMSTEVDDDFSNVTINISKAITNLKTAYTEFVGESDAVTDSAKAIAEGIEAVAENLDGFVKAVGAVGAVIGTLVLTKFIRGLAASEKAALSATGALGKFNVALAALQAGVIGFTVGSYLRDQFLEVELAGIALAEGLTKLGAVASATFDILTQPLNAGETLDNLTIQLANIEKEYGALADAAVNAQTKTEQGAKKSTEAIAQQAEAVKGLTLATGDAAAAAKTLGVEVAGGMEQAEKNTKAVAESMITMIASAESVGISIEQSVIAAISKLSNSELPTLKSALTDAFASGLLVADEFTAANTVLNKAIGKTDDTTKLLKQSIEDAYDAGELSVIEYRKEIEALNKKTVDTYTLSSGLRQTLAGAWRDGKIEANDYLKIVQSVSGKTTLAEGESDRLKAILQNLFDAGIIGAEDYLELVQEITGAQKDASESAGELTKAMDALGLQSSESLSKAATTSKLYYNEVKRLGGTTSDVRKAFLAYAEAQLKAAEATGSGVDSTLKAEAASLGLKGELTTLAERYGLVKKAADQVSGAQNDAAKSSDKAADAADNAADSTGRMTTASKIAATGLGALSSSYQDAALSAARLAEAEGRLAKVRDSDGYTQDERDRGQGASVYIPNSQQVADSISAAQNAGVSESQIAELANTIFNQLVNRAGGFTAEDYQKALDRALQQQYGVGGAPTIGVSAMQSLANTQSINAVRQVKLTIQAPDGEEVEASIPEGEDDKLVNMLQKAGLTA